ncbi:neurogenic locus Notch protein-like [Ylistrum balloti]|uniref:neurogenic locus Notch protein-like n=1 Tax=Ylistrum balloti TaxID=509963 RepID=UPI0029058E78|nr:neurogenic locus Notch protein-like [Ylistrum balloti]
MSYHSNCFDIGKQELRGYTGNGPATSETILSVRVLGLNNPQNLMATETKGAVCCVNYEPPGIFGCKESCSITIEVCYLDSTSSSCVKTFTSNVLPAGYGETHFGSPIGNLSNPVIIHIPTWSGRSRYRVTAYADGNFQNIIGQLVVQPNPRDIAPDELHAVTHHASMAYFRTGASLSTDYKIFQCQADPSLHQTCNEQGLVVCKDPYYGVACSQQCSIFPVQGAFRGTCIQGVGPICQTGWTGQHCSIPDLCSNNPCQNSGHCVTDSTVPAYGYRCECSRGWTGRLCDQIDACSFHSCNHGNCTNDNTETHGYRCQCRSGWTGDVCDVDFNECQFPGTCSDRGTCRNLAGSFSCNCEAGWSGKTCDTSLCPTGYIGANCTTITSCENNGFKVQGPTGIICQCPYGWAGARCEIDEDECASANACQNNGTCINRPGSFICACQSGWRGHRCEADIDECVANPCMHGNCSNSDGSYQCTCENGWMGIHCETDVDECEHTVCQNNGTCINFAGNFHCKCPDGYGGGLCEYDIDECANVTCLNFGVCVDGVNEFTCQCPQGYTGKLCEVDIDECLSNPCVHGTCSDEVAQYNCHCQQGWSGVNCDKDVDECDFSPCENGGNCTNNPGSYSCACVLGFVGTGCEINIDDCSSSPCMNNATCVDQINDFTCLCFGQFTGKQCNVYNFCAYNPCDHGKCVVTDKTPKCLCDSGWEGVSCQYDIDECAQGSPCSDGKTCVNTAGSYECDSCNATYCGVNGTCSIQNSVPTCTCGHGWTGEDCSREDFCVGNPCSSHLECVNTLDGYMCHHHHDKDLCVAMPCENGGSCEFHAHYTPPSYECHCSDGWTGTTCTTDIDECSTSPCASDHVCVNTAGGYACVKHANKRSALENDHGIVTLEVDSVIQKSDVGDLHDLLTSLTCGNGCGSPDCSVEILSYSVQSRFSTSTFTVLGKCGGDVINQEAMYEVLDKTFRTIEKPRNHQPCQQTQTSTRIQGQHNIKFNSSIGNLSNPIIFQVKQWTMFSAFTVKAFEDKTQTRTIGMFDVFPYLSKADTSQSTARFHEKRSVQDHRTHASLHVRFQVYESNCSPDPASNKVCDSNGHLMCAPHYYGLQCNKRCIPTQNGYCDNSGNLVCNSSYYGLHCNKQCITPPSHGHCDSNGTLRCDTSYYGLHCDKQCITPPSHGYCDSYGTLRCDQSYYGLHCDKQCITPPSHGRCDSNGTLRCDPSYYGLHCDKQCITPPSHGHCNSNGRLRCDMSYYGLHCDKQCVTPPSHGHCDSNGTLRCDPSYYGLHCDKQCITPPSHGHCESNGTLRCDMSYYGLHCDKQCVNPPSHGHCDSNGTLRCDTSYYGLHCDKQCITPPSHGRCDSNGTLRCDPSYYGLHCDKQCVTPPSHGHCDSNGTLKCDTSYYGLHCDKQCITPPSHGHCDSNGRLRCDMSYYGLHCDKQCVTPPSHGHCDSNGTLRCDMSYYGLYCDKQCITPPSSNGTLHCDPPFEGLNCNHSGSATPPQVSGCLAHSCLNRGTCTYIANTYRCQCPFEYTGTNCEILNVCAYSPCRHGQCATTASGFHCNCEPGWTGFTCETDINECLRSVCSSGQTCVNNFGSYTCLSCEHTICQNNGTCIYQDHAPVCKCGRGWTGPDCSIPDSCLDNPCGHYRRCEAFPDGYYCHYVDNICSLSPCKNGGSCRQNGHGFICECSIGYKGEICDEIDPCSSQPCLNGATCTYDTNTYTCTCAKGWIGRTCNEVDYCASTPCNNNGVCVNGKGDYTCVCPVGFQGRDCMKKDFCFNNPCYTGTTCISSATTYECICPPDMTGAHCNNTKDKCNPSPCLNHALCETVGEAVVCYCLGGWDGEICGNDINECEVNPCPTQLSCVNYPGGFSCTEQTRRSPRFRLGSVTQIQGGTQVNVSSLLTKENIFSIKQRIEDIVNVRLCTTQESSVQLLGLNSDVSFGMSTIEILVLCGSDVIDSSRVSRELQDFV